MQELVVVAVVQACGNVGGVTSRSVWSHAWEWVKSEVNVGGVTKGTYG